MALHFQFRFVQSFGVNGLQKCICFLLKRFSKKSIKFHARQKPSFFFLRATFLFNKVVRAKKEQFVKRENLLRELCVLTFVWPLFNRGFERL